MSRLLGIISSGLRPPLPFFARMRERSARLPVLLVIFGRRNGQQSSNYHGAYDVDYVKAVLYIQLQ